MQDPCNNDIKINGDKIIRSSNCDILIKVVKQLRDALNMSV